ncbi:MAG TPA: protein phosphatase 2C domain-containing protein [Wenzhouxiangella sp.]|nr:protein phosphatase 2C domain-containing protein [Wenzhouxiangella sp.]
MTDTQDAVRSGVSSAVGHVREHNEDYFVAAPDLGFWAVADGMGGHSAGEIASRIACESLLSAARSGKTLQDGIKDADRAIAKAIEAGDGAEGMGTTVVAVQLNGRRYDIAWIGDSRAYLWQDDQLCQLTHDHSFVQQLLDHDAIAVEEAECHPAKHILTRCLGGGTGGPAHSDLISSSFFAGEILILCTDGISGEVSAESLEQEIRAQVAQSHSPEIISKALVELALDHGGKDNATAVVIMAPDNAPERVHQTVPSPSTNSKPNAPQGLGLGKRNLLIAVILFVFLMIVLLAFLWPDHDSENGTVKVSADRVDGIQSRT